MPWAVQRGPSAPSRLAVELGLTTGSGSITVGAGSMRKVVTIDPGTGKAEIK